MEKQFDFQQNSAYREAPDEEEFNDFLLSSNQGASNLQQQTRHKVSLKNDELNRSVKQETKALDGIAETNKEIDGFYQQAFDKKWGLTDRLFNGKMHSQVQQVKTELVKTSAKYRLAFYRTLLDTRLEALNEKCNAGLKCIKSYHRAQITSFVLGKKEELQFEIRDRQIVFLEMMKGKYQYAETLKAYPSMYERFTQSLLREEECYLFFLDSLVMKFESLLDEEIRKY